MAKNNRNNTHNTPKQEADSLHRKAIKLAKIHAEMERQTEFEIIRIHRGIIKVPKEKYKSRKAHYDALRI